MFLFSLAPAALACTCSKAPPGVCPGLQQDDVVFLGTVTQAENVSPGGATPASGPLTRYHFRIDEKYAGLDAAEIDIFSGGDDGDCGFRFEQGAQYVVFSDRADDGRLFATICSSTRPASEARALLPQLRAMRNGQRVASVFGVLRRADPPLLAPLDDPDDPLPHIKLKLRSKDDRFATSTGPDGVYSFYDVHAGEYRFTADLPARFEFTQKTLHGALPPFKIPNGACYEYNVEALPTGKIRGSVLGPGGKPLAIASVELYRAERYDDGRPGLWGFQGPKGNFEFDHIGPGEYTLVFNRMNRLDPNSPFPRTFFPGAPELAGAKLIRLKDGQQVLNANIKLSNGYAVRRVRVHLKWEGTRQLGEVTVMARADRGENPAALKVADGVYEFALLESARYTISAWQDLDPHRAAARGRGDDCALPARIETAAVAVEGADSATKDVTLEFAAPKCEE
jgi:hypothetical protein